MVKYQVHRWSVATEQWMEVPFAEGPLSYCKGWVDAMDSLYPSHPYRVVYINTGEGTIRVMHETRGNGAPHTN